MKNRGIRTLCFFVALLFIFAMSGCSTGAKKDLLWKTQDFSAEIVGEISGTPFSASLKREGNQCEILYHSPEMLSNVKISVSDNEVTVGRENLSETYSQTESVKKLLLPLLMMTSSGQIQKVLWLESEKHITVSCEDLVGVLELCETKEGIPKFLQNGDCAFSVTDFIQILPQKS